MSLSQNVRKRQSVVDYSVRCNSYEPGNRAGPLGLGQASYTDDLLAYFKGQCTGRSGNPLKYMQHSTLGLGRNANCEMETVEDLFSRAVSGVAGDMEVSLLRVHLAHLQSVYETAFQFVEKTWHDRAELRTEEEVVGTTAEQKRETVTGLIRMWERKQLVKGRCIELNMLSKVVRRERRRDESRRNIERLKTRLLDLKKQREKVGRKTREIQMKLEHLLQRAKDMHDRLAE